MKVGIRSHRWLGALLCLALPILFSTPAAALTLKNWTGAGAGGSGTNFSDGTKWNPTGVPAATDSCVMNITSDQTFTLAGSLTIGALVMNSTTSGANAVLNVSTNTLTVAGSLTADVTSGTTTNTTVEFLVGNAVGSTGSIVVNGNANFAVNSGTSTNSGRHVYLRGFQGSLSSYVFRNNVTFGDRAGVFLNDEYAGKVQFAGTGSRTVTNNAATQLEFGTMEFGDSVNTVTWAWTGTGPAQLNLNADIGPDFNINANTTLDLTTKTLNRSSTGGNLLLGSNATLKLGATTGGTTGSNFPNNWTATLRPTSTVEYNASGSQTIFSTPAYGNLTLSTGGTKTAGGALTVAGNLTIGSGVTFAGGTSLTHNVGGNWTNNGSFTFTTANTINFNTAPAKTIGGSASTAFSALTVNTAGGVGLARSASVAGTLTLTSGALSVASAQTLTLNGGTTVTGGSLTSAADGTVSYNQGSNGQSVVAGAYGNLTFSNFNKTLASSGTIGIAGTFTTGTATGHTVTGSTVLFNGASPQSQTGAFTYNNLTLNNAAGLSIGGNTTVNTTLTFSASGGKISTGANTLALASANSTGASQANGWVNGNFKRTLPAGTSTRAFDVGSATLYAPVSLAMTGLAAQTDITANTTSSDHPNLAGSGLDPAKSVNRYWTLTPTGSPSFTSYDVTFNFDPSDVDGPATPANFVVGRYSSPNWNGTTVGTRTATSTQATGVTAFSDFAVAEVESGSYPLSVSTVGNGTVSKSPDLLAYISGSIATLTATPVTGYHFVAWSGDATGSTNPLDVTMDAAKSITATFAIDTHTLTLASGGNGTVGQVPTGPTYNHGTAVTATATPATGYHFVNWTGDTTATTNPLPLIMARDYNLTANFAINTYTLTLNPTPAAGGTAAPDLVQPTYDHGTVVNLTATPAAHYHFVNWTGAGFTTTTANPAPVTMTQNFTLAANFALDTYTLTMSTTGTGTTSPAGTTTQNYGTALNLTATPGTGFHFVDWSGDTSATTNPLPVVITQDRSLTANFAINTYTLNVTTVGNGTVGKSPDQATYDHGTSVTLTATPDPGYAFVGWSGDLTGSTNPATFTMTANRNITATFIAATLPFAQGFQFSNTLADYVIGTGSISQDSSRFDAFGTTGGSSTVAVTGNALQFVRGSSGTVSFSRATDIVNPAAGAIVYQFNLQKTAGTSSGTTTAVLRVGSGFGTANSDETDGNTFGKIAIDQTTTSNTYQLRNIATGQLTPNITTNALITWVLNKSGATYSYIAPNGTVQTVASNKMDLWVGTTLSTGFDEMAITTAAANLTDLKFFWNSTSSTMVFDNFRISSPTLYNLNVATVGSGSVVKSPNQSAYANGSVVQLTATPATGWHFVSWSGDASGGTSPTSVTMDSDKNVTATFAINTYTLTTTPDANGTIGRAPDQATYDHFTPVTLTGTPNAGYHFVSWGGDTTTTTNPLTLVMTRDRNLTATFAATYLLSAVSSGNGSVAKSPDQPDYNPGDQVTLTATPNPHYHFVNWTGDTTATGNPLLLTITRDRSLTANFAIDTYTLTMATTGTGTTSPAGTTTQNYGAALNLTATPGTGFHFVDWSGDTSATTNPLPVVITQNRSLIANFAINTYTLNISTVGTGTVGKSPDQATYDHGTTVTLTATAAPGFIFSGWSGDLSGSTNPTTISMTANRNVTANFFAAALPFVQDFQFSNNVADYLIGGAATQNGKWDAFGSSGGGSSVTVVGNALQIIRTSSNTVTFSRSTDIASPAPGAIIYAFNLQKTAGTSAGTTSSILRVGSGFGTANSDETDGNTFGKIAIDQTSTSNTYQLRNIATGQLTPNITTNALITWVLNKSGATYSYLAPNGTIQTVANNKMDLWVGTALNTGFDEMAITTAAAALTDLKFFWSSSPATMVFDNFSITSPTLYALNVTTVGSGSVTKNPNQAGYTSGQVVQLTAVPATGWHFVGWSGDASGGASPTSVTMDADKNVTATFAINTYTLTTTPDLNGSIGRSPDQVTYNHGTSVTLTGTPNAGYHFVSWGGDTTTTTNPLTLVMTRDRNLTAAFSNTYTLTATAGANGSVAKSPDQPNYVSGDQVTLTATPNPHYHFVNWTGDTTATGNPLLLTITRDRSLTANFAIDTYTLTMATTGTGTTSPAGTTTQNYGAALNLTATPGTGFHFVDWSGDTSATTNPLPVVITQNRSLTANFAINTYTLNVTTVGTGTVGKSPDQATYDHGTTVTLTATPAVGFVFTGWSGDLSGSTNPTTISMTANRNVTATFVAASLPFAQDFQFSNTLADYLIGGAATQNGKWDAFGTTGGSSTVSVVGNTLQFNRASGGTVTFSRSTDIAAPAPSAIVYQFNLQKTAGTSAGTTTAILRVGSGFGTNNADETDGNTFGKIAIDQTSTSNTYQLRNIASGQLTPNITTNALITWVLNKSASTFSYLAPNGTVATVAGSKMDLWVGTTLSTGFDEMAITTATAGLTDLKFFWGGTSATMAFDNFNISSPTLFALNLTTVGNGTVTKNPNQAAYTSGSVVQLTASPSPGWSFSGWSGDASGNTNPLSVTMDAAKNITATFVQPTFTITASAGANGSIAPTGVTTVTQNANQNYVITPDPCYQVQDVLVDGASVGAVTSFNFVNVTANHTISVTFAPTPNYTITASAATGGTVTPAGATLVACGGSQTYTIAPSSSCYSVFSVVVDGLSVGAVTSYTFNNVNANHTISATFAPATLTIAASAGPGGTITQSGNIQVGCNDNQGFLIDANPCFHVDSVLVDNVNVGAVGNYIFFNVTANHTIRAVFAPSGPFTINASAGPNGSISPAGPTSVSCNASQVYTITPDPCYHVSSVIVDGSSVGPVTTYTFSNVQAGHSITAFFALDVETVNATAGSGGNIAPAGLVSVNCSASQAFTITPNACFHVADVLVDGASVGAVISYTLNNVTANHTVAASFAINGPFDLTASAGANGSISPPGVTSVTCGANQTYTITPDACFAVANVLVDGGSVGAVTSYTFSNVTAAHTISASFVPAGPFTITAIPNPRGSISPSGATIVSCGGSQAYTITAASCYHVSQVLVDGVSVGAVTSYTFNNVTGNHTIEANYQVDVYTITPSAGPGGTITQSAPVQVSCDDSQGFLIEANPCFHIADVKVDGVSVGAVGNYIFAHVNANHTIAATFAPDQKIITASAGANGSISPSGSVPVDCNGSQTFTITPNSCYQISDVLVDGSSVGAVASYTFTNVTVAHTISASFVINATYTVTASAGAHGAISPSGGVVVNCGANQTFTITADPCYHITDVLVDGSSAGAGGTYTFTNVTANHTIAASFAIDLETITASAGAHGSITPNGGTSVSCGANQTYTITPDACYQIADVLVDGSSVGAVGTYTFTNVTASHTIAASFAATPYTITASAGLNGSISPSGAAIVGCGSNATYSITADPCYHIADVLVDGSSVGPVTSYTFSAVGANHTISASFAINTYSLTASAGANGSISPSGVTTLQCGAGQLFFITANTCYHIVDVLVDGASVGPVTSYAFTNVTASHTISASFAIDTYTLTASAGPHGSISPVGLATVDCGTNHTYTITPDACYQIADVLVDGSSVGTAGTYTFNTVGANHTISASFVANPEIITASAGLHGSISPAGAVSVDCGTDKTFTIAADACYHIADVLVDGSSVGATATYTFTNVTANHTIAASFAVDVETITASAGLHGSISPSGATSVDCGANQTFTITPDPCYHIANVLVDGGSVGAVGTYTFTNVTAGHTIAASFAIDTYTLTASAGPNGSISPVGGATVGCGASATYTITPDPCYHIADVLVDGSSVGAVGTYTFNTVGASHTISASFAIDVETITASAGLHGSITPVGATSVNCGANKTFTITADPCYHILDVLVDGGSVGNGGTYTFTNVTANHTIAASFAIDTYTLTASAGPNGSISPVGAATVDCGSSHTYTITPDAGYHVLDVLVDGGSVGPVASYTFNTVGASHTIAASFSINTYSLVASAGAHGSISPSGTTVVSHGANQTYTITPDPCYHIEDVLVDGGSVGTGGTYTFSGIAASHTISASFAIDVETITASAGAHGSITPPGANSVFCGGNRPFVITPDACYHILDVLVDGGSVGAVATYTFSGVTASHTISASFAIDTYTLTASAGSHGSISPVGAATVDCGTNHTYTITPDACYQIADVLVDGSSVGATGTYTFNTVGANHTISASFVASPEVITASAGLHGSISPVGATTVDCGTNKTFTITPDACYHIADVLVDGSSVGAVGTYTFTNVTANHTIAASFAVDVETITASAGLHGSISPSGATSVDCGTNRTFTITPDPCYHIVDVLVDGGSVGNVGTYTFTNVTAGHTIAASFAIDTYTLTASAGSNGSISPVGAATVDCGTTHAYTITPDAGYHVADVLVDGSSVGPVTSYTFNAVGASHTIAASFAIDTYTIAATAGTHGSITPSGSVVVSHGADQGFTITPDPCYHTVDVVVDGSSLGAVGVYTFHSVTANHTISATFAIDTYTINANAGSNGSISPSGATSVDCGTNKTFTITADPGYHVEDVVVDGGSVGATGTYTFNAVGAGHSISASFAINVYTIAASAGAHGAISPSGSVNANHGDNKTFTITPDPCYHIDDVLVDGGSVGAVGTYTFTNVTASHTISASFAINTYALTVTQGAHGTISPGTITVDCGADQAFTITPAACYHTVDVVVDGSSLGPVGSYTFHTVSATHTITATFAVDTYTINASALSNGSISPSGATSVDCGTNQTFTITADPGYHVDDVLVDGGSVGGVGTYTFNTVIANHTISASFAINTYTITASAGANGSISPSGSVGVSQGASPAFVITANAGFHIADVLVDGSSVGATGNYTFNNVTANHTIAASFATNAHTVAASAGANGSISPSGAVTVNDGANQTFTITADPGYHVANVLVDGGSVGATGTYTFTNVTADHTISASFAINTFTIAASAGANGSIAPSGSVSVNQGASQAFTITANPGYHVLDVLVDGSTVGAVGSYTFNSVTANHTIAASFAINTYTIAASAGANGSISPSGSVIVNHGASQAFTITANPGYHVLDVLVDGSTVGAVGSYTFNTVTAGHTIAASFAINTYTIVASAGANGSISPSGSVIVNHGASQAFTITANPGFNIADVLVDGSSVGAVGGYTFNTVTAGHTIAASFAANVYALNVTVVGGGSVNRNPNAASYANGTTVQLTPSPSAGYTFMGWSGDASGNANPLSVLMTSAKNITATFADVTLPAVTVTMPNGGQVWGTGTNQVITWTATDGVGVSTVDVLYSLTGVAPWTTIASAIPNSGSRTWLTPGTPSTTARVCVVAHDAAANAGVDSSDATFELRDDKAPTMAITTPNGGEVWGMGSAHKLTWKATDAQGVTSIKLEYSTNSGSTWSLIAALLPNSPSNYTWVVPNIATTTALVRGTARDAAGNTTADVSNAVFEIRDTKAPTMTVTTPNGGEVWLGGSIHKTTWKATDNIGVTSVSVEYSSNGGSSWSPVASGLANTGFYFWTVPTAVTSNAKVRMTAFDAQGNSTSDVSNSVFRIGDGTPPLMTVTTPNGAENWVTGSTHKLTWKTTDNVGVATVDLESSIDNGGTWAPIATGLTTTLPSGLGSYMWLVPNTPSTLCLIRGTSRDAAGNATPDVSNAVFIIRDATAPVAALTSPVGGEVWLTSSAHAITWTATDNVGVTTVDLDYSANAGGTWTPIAAGLANSGSFAWTTPATATTTARVRLIARDAATNATTVSSTNFTLQAPVAAAAVILEFRADSANGTGAYASPSSASPWKDLRGGHHDGSVNQFAGWSTSGWTGNGTHASPRRLEFGNDLEHVTIPGGSIPELTATQPVTAELWFKTGYNGASAHYDYLLEWLKMGNTGSGMSIAVQDGRLQVYLNPWVDAGPVAPNTWYHIAVAKEPGHVRIYLNGNRVYTGTNPNMGPQETELALGCSVFRIAEGIGSYGDYLRGSISQFKLWRSALGDAEVHTSFLADSGRYLPSTPITPLAKLVTLKADSANGTGHYTVPGTGGPWVDLTGTQTNATLQGFNGNTTSGWQGNGTVGNPYRLKFDGVNDLIKIPAAAVTQLQSANAYTAELWFTTGTDVSHTDEQYLLEWLQDFGSPKGLSIAIAHDNFRVYTSAPFWANAFPVAPNTSYHATVVKKPGELRVYMNGTLMYTDPNPNFGVPNSEIVIGASTYNGAGQYADYLATGCTVSGFTLWQGAMTDGQVTALRGPMASIDQDLSPPLSLRPEYQFRLGGFRPNPATHEMNVVFTLPTAHPATLELIDVTGRRVASREVGSLGPGDHSVSLGSGRNVPAGMYWLRLTQQERVLTTKATVVH